MMRLSFPDPDASLVLAALAMALGIGLAGAPVARAQAKSSAPAGRVLPASNSAILLSATRGAAATLIAQVPLTPGTKVALRPEADGRFDQDVRDALVEALTRRRIQCVLLAPVATDSTGAPGAAPGSAQASAPGSAAPAGPGAGTPAAGTPAGSATPTAGDPPGLAEMGGSFAALQAERQAQAARAESLARTGPGAGAGGATSPGTATGAAGAVQASVLATGTDGPLPILTVRVREARVDYVRQFRGGLFGAQRIERRALASLSLRLSPPGSEAVSWTASADSAVGDVVLKSDLASLEDRQRPETRGTVPSAGFKKVLEPLLVVILVAGLVSLFYQNRP